jgi:hypothetical protein
MTKELLNDHFDGSSEDHTTNYQNGADQTGPTQNG